jgi:DNA repair protein RadC
LTAETPDDDRKGHRGRLRQRFLAGGSAALHDYEILELLLFLALPRQDTKKVAKALISRFGSYGEVILATPADLKTVDGVGDAIVVALKTVAAAAERLARHQVIDRPVLSSWDRLIEYLRISMGHGRTEQFRVLFLDTRNALIADEVQQTGTVNHTPVYPREVLKRALEVGATAIIMVHNHPSGDPTPSQADIAMTREVKDAGASLGIALHDHVIITRANYRSMRAMGLI